MTKLPVHLNALKAFEASARHQSFAAAANELNVTPAAVGQLVRGLEDWLGTPLFHRNSGGRVRLVTTAAAEQALPDLRAGFDRLSMGLERLKAGSAAGALTVTVSPAFAAKWLLPRIERFQEAWPDLEIRLDTSLKPLDFAEQRVDIGVRYGRGDWPGLRAEKLLEEDIFPVCSPRWLGERGPIQAPVDLIQQILIHDLSMEGHVGFPGWDAWLQLAGVTRPVRRRGLKINSAAAVLQAAIDGQGIALARSVMAQDDVAAGRLVRLFPEIAMSSPLAYHAVYREECLTLARVKAFRDWLMAQAGRG